MGSVTEGTKTHYYNYDGIGRLVSLVTYENGSPYSMVYNNGTDSVSYYYVTNLQGDVIALLSEGESVVAEYVYDAWGNILSITDRFGVDLSSNATHIANLNPLRYRGYVYDNETGFYYLQSRYYDPSICRFVNFDTLLNQTSFLGYNLFSYCENNSVNSIDRNGHFFEKIKKLKELWNGVKTTVEDTYESYSSPTKKEHYSRNDKNKVPNEDELMDIVTGESDTWFAVDDKLNAYHRFENGDQGTEDRYNKKYMTEDGKNEVIICYDEEYVPEPYIVTDPNNLGTYNYGPGTGIKHFIKDVWPYWKYKNSQDDTTNILQRVFGN